MGQGKGKMLLGGRKSAECMTHARNCSAHENCKMQELERWAPPWSYSHAQHCGREKAIVFPL